jgi:hypothetical protein
MPDPSFLDVGSLSGPIQEFIKRVSKAVGILYEPKRIVKRAKAEAEAKLIQAKTDAAINEIRIRAEARDQYLRYRQQANIESIVKMALPLIDESKSQSDFDEDWMIQFFNASQDIGDIEMQRIWSKVLAGEYNHTGSFSNRSLHAVKLLRKKEADLITRFYAAVCILDGDVYAAIHIKPNRLQAFGISDLMVEELKDIGIISDTMHFPLPNENIIHQLEYFGDLFEFHKSQRVSYEPAVIFYILSTVGKELFRIAGAIKDSGYFSTLHKYFAGSGIEIVQVRKDANGK